MRYIFLFVSLLSINCYYSDLPKEKLKTVPKDANKIILVFDMPKDSLFILVSDFLTNNNYRIYSHDKEVGFINTDSKSIPHNMNLRLNLMISQKGEHSELSCKGEWNLAESTNEQDKIWRKADMSKGTFWKIGYENMVIDMGKLPYKEIHYVKE